MNKSGSPDSEVTTPTPTKRGGWGAIIVAAFALIFGFFVVSRFVPVLYAVFFPPEPPRPVNTVELSRESQGYGTDTVMYSSPDDGCAMTRYYEARGATCRVAPTVCTTGFVQLEQPRAGTQVSRCNGEIDFSIFLMRYRAEIYSGYETQTEDSPTRLRLEREIFWTGQAGAPTDADATLTP